jgi:DNA-binding protein HU-beta
MRKMTEATTVKKSRAKAPKAEAKTAAPKEAKKGTTKNRKQKVFGIDDMVQGVWEAIQADENSPKSAKEALTKVALKFVLQTEQDLIVGAVSNGDKVSYVGFGGYEQRERAARKGRNPQTGVEMDIAAKKVPAFKPGKGFKDAVK